MAITDELTRIAGQSAAPKPGLPILRPEHFKNGSVRLARTGLELDETISVEDRQMEVADIEEPHLIHLLEAPPTRIMLNPPQPSAKILRMQLERAQANGIQHENFNIDYNLPSPYARAWVLEEDDSGRMEGQDLVLVAFDRDRDRAAGYASLTARLLHPDPQEKVFFLSFIIHLVYVRPQCRGKGYGMDLSIACGYLCSGVLDAVYRAVPARKHIEASVQADFDSLGGERFADQVYSSLQEQKDLLREGRRRSVSLEVELDAGW